MSLRPWMTGKGGHMMTKMATLSSYAHLLMGIHINSAHNYDKDHDKTDI